MPTQQAIAETRWRLARFSILPCECSNRGDTPAERTLHRFLYFVCEIDADGENPARESESENSS